MARLDLVSLTVQLESTAEQLRQFREDLLRRPRSRDPRSTIFLRKIVHERSHLFSFLSSGLAGVHRSIMNVQFHLAQGILWEVHQNRLLEGVTVPILDRHGRLFPNALTPRAKLKIDAANRRHQGLDTLVQFMVGYPPACRREDLVHAYHDFLSMLASVEQQHPRFAHESSEWDDRSQRASAGIRFMNDQHHAVIVPQICDARADCTLTMPVLPRIHVHNVSGFDSPMVISARSVLEGLAIIGELAGMRGQDVPSRHGVRRNVPAAYGSGLVYCLHCINQVSGQQYNVDQLLGGHLPEWALITMGAMLDLALQIEAPTNPASNHTALVEKCPAWRLLLIGDCVKRGDVPLIGLRASFDGGEIRDWSHSVCAQLAWTPREGGARRRKLGAEITGADLLQHMSDVAAVLRERYQLDYLTGRDPFDHAEWLDFTAWETGDGQPFFPTQDHIQARKDFIGIQRRRHYAVPALVFGHHWDHWWQRQGVSTPHAHASQIAENLDYAVRMHPGFDAPSIGGIPPFAEGEILVREEFNDIFG